VRDSAQCAVRVLVELVSTGDDVFESCRGGAALNIAREIEAALAAQLEGTLGHVLLWEQFLRTPEAVASAVVSVLGTLLERDQVLARWLDESLEAYYRAGNGLS
jgi:hypothetical protein